MTTEATIRPTININGESREFHINARIEARDALHEAMKRLSALRPHGRDYPGPDGLERFERDIAEHQRRFNSLTALWNVLLDEALELQREED